MHNAVPGICRFVFWVHLLVAAVLGVLLLVFPGLVAEWLGYRAWAEWIPVIRSYGAMILGIGGVTSYLGTRARGWDQVEFIVRGEIVYLLLSTVVLLIGLLQESGPTLASAAMAGLSLLFLILFFVAWLRRPIAS
ncbi:MAG: hypothetical protein GXX94_06010 [Chloroflexi bacterium]|nr:hypothetical protein [Chloroflexota bacterium]